jgi:quinol monooxygenase YgiN
MANVVVVALLRVHEGRGEEAAEALRPVIEGTHGEAGCLTYALHRDRSDPDRFALVERWTSPVALEAHFQQPHMSGLAEIAGELLAEPPQIVFCDPVALGDPVKGAL